MSAEDVTARLPALLVGRFQPFHNGHLFMVKMILEDFDRLIIGIGSAQYGHTDKNPFTSEERHVMIEKALDAEGIFSCELLLIEDLHDHSAWVPFVESIVPRFRVVFSNDPLTVSLFREKGYEVRELPLHNRENYSGTEVRKRIARNQKWEHLVPHVVAEYIKEIEGERRIRDLAGS